MHPDEDLIIAAKKAVRNGGATGVDAGKDREALGSLIDDYRTACELGRGPDPGRKRHWNVEATSLEKRLRAIANGDDTPRKLPKGINRTAAMCGRNDCDD